ncbi:HPF/RaiA family ribosome-associated protein [Aquimarina agarivorans]|uniref:HPF/RaiA family ribosome-associated protein n=1 Tax=Aquimarina agarivorans TaxID=980584 RepID=UPI000248EBAF|nr:HPF/RaiA family ribosome-associated protein [Aquimarina agarivorans]
MKTNVHFVHMETSPTLNAYVLEKINNLFKKYDWIIKTDISFIKKNDSKGKGKVCDIEVSIPGALLYATSDEDKFEFAFKNSLSDIEVQLKKSKQQRKPHI